MTQKKKTLADIIEEELKKFDAKTDAIVSKKFISKQYDKAVKNLDAWEKKTFKGKGALGKFPDWFYEYRNEVIRLSIAREWLVLKKKCSLKEIREMIDKFKEHQKNHQPISFDPETYGHISVVCSYDDAIFAGPDEGPEMMVGPTMADHVQKHQRIKKGSTKGAEVRFGTQEERDEERQVFQNSIDKLHKIQPKWSHTALCKGVAPQFNVNYRTIYRRTDSPHAKK